jgi:hypothetical protein
MDRLRYCQRELERSEHNHDAGESAGSAIAPEGKSTPPVINIMPL